MIASLNKTFLGRYVMSQTRLQLQYLCWILEDEAHRSYELQIRKKLIMPGSRTFWSTAFVLKLQVKRKDNFDVTVEDGVLVATVREMQNGYSLEKGTKM